jgi:hypothetical protein
MYTERNMCKLFFLLKKREIIFPPQICFLKLFCALYLMSNLVTSPRKSIQIFKVFLFYFKTVDTEYTYYSWCKTSTDIVKWRKNERLWKFWKRNDLYENFEKRGESFYSILFTLHLLLVMTSFWIFKLNSTCTNFLINLIL